MPDTLRVSSDCQTPEQRIPLIADVWTIGFVMFIMLIIRTSSSRDYVGLRQCCCLLLSEGSATAGPLSCGRARLVTALSWSRCVCRAVLSFVGLELEPFDEIGCVMSSILTYGIVTSRPVWWSEQSFSRFARRTVMIRMAMVISITHWNVERPLGCRWHW